MLKETLTDRHFKLLGNKRKRSNPLNEIIDILRDYLESHKSKCSETNNQKKSKKCKKQHFMISKF